jgi:hypothetical protein
MAPLFLQLAHFWTTTAAAAFIATSTPPSFKNIKNRNLLQQQTSTTTNSHDSSSPWSPAEWRFDLNFGRETNSVYMPAAWGASGARLVLPVDVLIESVSYSTNGGGGNDHQTEIIEFLGGSGKADRLCILEDAVYISKKGQETVVFEAQGAWKIHQRRTGKPGDAGQLRFYVDIAKKQQQHQGQATGFIAERNDVTLLAERYYCTAKCWRASELDIGMQRFRPIQNAANQAQRDIDERLQHDTGDRRLDGTNPIETAMASLDMAVLVKKRDDLLVQLREAERTLPNTSSASSTLSKPGMWPGTTERLVIAPGTITVKRKVGNGLLLGGGEEHHIVGTWTATPYEGLSEYVDVDEEEEGEDDSENQVEEASSSRTIL